MPDYARLILDRLGQVLVLKYRLLVLCLYSLTRPDQNYQSFLLVRNDNEIVACGVSRQTMVCEILPVV
jgi:hypothetical protein